MFESKTIFKNKFIWFVIGAVGVLTYIALDEALESPDRP